MRCCADQAPRVFLLAQTMIHTQGSLVTVSLFPSHFLIPSLFLAFSAIAGIGCTGTAPAATEPPPPPVHAAIIEPEAVTPISTATAEILANRQSNMRSETAGRVVEVLVEAGDRAEEGQVLLRASTWGARRPRLRPRTRQWPKAKLAWHRRNASKLAPRNWYRPEACLSSAWTMPRIPCAWRRQRATRRARKLA